MTYYKNIENIRKKNESDRFADEQFYLETLCTPDDTDGAIVDRIEQLKTIRHEMNKKNTVKNVSMFDQLDKVAYKRPWHRLNSVYKTHKLREYYADKDMDDILNKLIKLVENKKLNTKKAVEYDPNTEKILSVPAVKYNKKKKIYEIKVKK